MSDLDPKGPHPGGEAARPEARGGKARDDAGDAGMGAVDPVNRSDPAPQAGNFVRQHPIAIAIVAVVVVAAVAGGFVWWLDARHYQSTDDAFIDARNVSISSQVTGMITGVPITDNQLVDAGGLLVQIDPRDYEAAVAQAEAQVEQAKAAIANLDSQIDAQKARIDQAKKQVEQTQAALTFAHQENDRAQDLVRRGAGTQQQSQQTTSNFTQAEANVASAQANEVAAEK
jgi:membrane fusion protein (multidrug efflux system)